MPLSKLQIIFLGIFSVMALSNAPIPILPEINSQVTVQGFIFSAYFFGAMISTLPAGFLSDRFETWILIRYSLLITIGTGIGMFLYPISEIFIAARVIEGIVAGIFVTSTLTTINRQKEHIHLSGYYMALLNAGLLAGLLIAGWMASFSGINQSGIFLFTILCLIAWYFSWNIHEDEPFSTPVSGSRQSITEMKQLLIDEWPLWLSVIVILGATGVVQSLYGAYTHESPAIVGTKLALMNGATIVASLIAPRISLRPLHIIRICAIICAISLILVSSTVVMIPILGIIAGIAYIAQMGYLAGKIKKTGMAMGMLTTMSYLGMMIFPTFGGIIAGIYSIPISFIFFSGIAVIAAVSIGKCHCTYQL